MNLLWNILRDMKRTRYKTLKEWRQSWALTQAEAGRLFGCSQSAYSKAETGFQTPRAPLAKRMADKTGVPLEVVLQVQ